jgi:uncharacterized protein
MYLIILFVLIVLILYLYYETTQLKLERVTISSDKIKGKLRILHLTDHHFRNINRLERKIISIAKKEEYDLLVMTGDYLHKKKYLDEFGDFLNKLNIHKPAFAVPGDNDQEINWNIFFEKTGITFLKDEVIRLDIDGNLINVIGVEKKGDLNKTAINKNEYNVILSHFYDIINEVKNEKEIDLILVGDTHGGQINIPLIGKRVIDLLFKFDYLKGKYNVNNTVLYVNRGIGTSKLNLRLRCRPEIALIEVEGRKSIN